MSLQSQPQPCAILALPTEIQLSIISQLGPPWPGERDNFTNLIEERFPDIPGLIALAATCKQFRDVCMPIAVKTLVLRNQSTAAASVAAVRKSEWARHVKQIWVSGSATIDHWGANDDAEDDPEHTELYGRRLKTPPSEYSEPPQDPDTFPPEFEAELKALAEFPSAEKLVISFPIDWKEIDYDEIDAPFVTDLEETERAENTNPARKMMASVFKTVFSAPLPRIMSFEMPDLNVAKVSEYSSDGFRRFLSQITSFKAEITKGNYDVENVGIPMFWGFRDELGPWFFHRLDSVEHFEFYPNTYLGYSGEGFCQSIGLIGTIMPRLKSLSLGTVFICTELIRFISQHLSHLESISFVNCYACTPSPAENDGVENTWARLFDMILESNSKTLVSFTLTANETKRDMLRYNEKPMEEAYFVEDNRRLEATKQKHMQNPDALCFPYGCLDDNDWWGASAERSCRDAYNLGRDEALFLEMQAFIDSNAIALGSKGITACYYGARDWSWEKDQSFRRW